MIQARKPSSSRIYYRIWKAYFRWCESNRVPPMVTFLVAITSIRRVSELAALSCRPPFLVIHQDKVVFRPPPYFLPKVVSTFHLNEDIVLPSFCPAPTHPLERSLNKLDLVRAVRIYLDRTSTFRKTDSFFVIPDGTRQGQPASKATIARWIRMAILEAYRVKNRVPPPGIKAHSTRAVGASWAVHHRASALQLCKAATWSSIHTFAKFYKAQGMSSRPYLLEYIFNEIEKNISFQNCSSLYMALDDLLHLATENEMIDEDFGSTLNHAVSLMRKLKLPRRAFALHPDRERPDKRSTGQKPLQARPNQQWISCPGRSRSKGSWFQNGDRKPSRYRFEDDPGIFQKFGNSPLTRPWPFNRELAHLFTHPLIPFDFARSVLRKIGNDNGSQSGFQRVVSELLPHPGEIISRGSMVISDYRCQSSTPDHCSGDPNVAFDKGDDRRLAKKPTFTSSQQKTDLKV
ncbi:unnamed protein product [Ranitomeya imitator]|uniref:Tyr recombinase domain-containing protein n=1 Tax=Ranitomeya imitator TaxID=111125 RepID=A0ABN9KV83_9NEOB|nr:unnamed protein product [Ranitomeya imitator]